MCLRASSPCWWLSHLQQERGKTKLGEGSNNVRVKGGENFTWYKTSLTKPSPPLLQPGPCLCREMCLGVMSEHPYVFCAMHTIHDGRCENRPPLSLPRPSRCQAPTNRWTIIENVQLEQGRYHFLRTLVGYAKLYTFHGNPQKFGLCNSCQKVAYPRLFVWDKRPEGYKAFA